MIQHEKYMKRCIELAKLGEGKVSPNPLVGAVVLDKYGNLAGEGFHEKYGEAHAEVNALNRAGENSKGGTLYINLEPCCHYGKTPPCIDRVIESGVKKLALGMTDPNPKVAGESIKKAREADIEVIENVLNTECMKLNEIFLKNIKENKPFIAIKTACTMDGKIATPEGKSKWITSESARRQVHRLRNKYDAILTGSKTVIADDPSLTCRLENGSNPVRIVIDSGLITPVNSKIYNDDGAEVIIATSKNTEHKTSYPKHIKFIECPLVNNKIDIGHLIKILYQMKIYSIIIESGGKLNGAFLEQNLADKVYFFLAPKLMGDENAFSSFEGNKIKNLEQCKMLTFQDVKSFPPDLMIEGYINEP